MTKLTNEELRKALVFARNMFSEVELVDSKGLLDWERLAELLAAYAREHKPTRLTAKEFWKEFRKSRNNSETWNPEALTPDVMFTFAEAYAKTTEAEGAAGVASPQTLEGKLTKLADWLKGWAIVDNAEANIALNVAIGQLFDQEDSSDVIELLSASATTAGPRPRCPKCGGDELSIASGIIACSCWSCDYEADFLEFFAAAPAEDTKEKTC